MADSCSDNISSAGDNWLRIRRENQDLVGGGAVDWQTDLAYCCIICLVKLRIATKLPRFEREPPGMQVLTATRRSERAGTLARSVRTAQRQ